MGDLAADTAVDGHDGRYSIVMSRDWEIWGPNGGYVSSVALRAAGAHSRFDRPASIVGNYLGVASFDAPVAIETTTLREAKRAESIRVTMSQGGRPVFEGLVWAVGDVEGLEHDLSEPPAVPDPTTLPSVPERLEAAGIEPNPPFPFWLNFDERPLEWVDDWENRPPRAPCVTGWFRYVPASTFDDLWVDACRSLILVDTMGWPAVMRHHVGDVGYIAPSIDIQAAFHRFTPHEEWLLTRSDAPSAHGGIIGARGDVWSRDGALLATGSTQMLCRPATRGPGS
jgi:acyl-CoA thioesterase